MPSIKRTMTDKAIKDSGIAKGYASSVESPIAYEGHSIGAKYPGYEKTLAHLNHWTGQNSDKEVTLSRRSENLIGANAIAVSAPARER
ncbi:MAG: hypothetical protein J6W11_03335 [Alphaproteobacteria bacterium]|nr:hypothetical protein [Alphaproteobacteria bacterium]